MSQTQTLTLWLSRLQSLQKEEPFQVLAGQWKEMIEQVLSQDEEEESSAFAEPA